jgi:hypothetical protein
LGVAALIDREAAAALNGEAALVRSRPNVHYVNDLNDLDVPMSGCR